LPRGTLRIIKEICTPSIRIFLRAYKVSELDTLEILANEYEELEKEREAFAQEKKLSRTKSAAQRKSRAKDAMNQATRVNGKCPGVTTTPGPTAASNRTTTRRSMVTTPTAIEKAKQHLLEADKHHTEAKETILVTDPQEVCLDLSISAAERQAGVAQCYPSKLSGTLIEEGQIGGNSYKATINPGATASVVSEELSANLPALGRITRTRRRVRLADGRRGGIDAQLEVEVKFRTQE